MKSVEEREQAGGGGKGSTPHSHFSKHFAMSHCKFEREFASLATNALAHFVWRAWTGRRREGAWGACGSRARGGRERGAGVGGRAHAAPPAARRRPPPRSPVGKGGDRRWRVAPSGLARPPPAPCLLDLHPAAWSQRARAPPGIALGHARPSAVGAGRGSPVAGGPVRARRAPARAPPARSAPCSVEPERARPVWDRPRPHPPLCRGGRAGRGLGEQSVDSTPPAALSHPPPAGATPGRPNCCALRFR